MSKNPKIAILGSLNYDCVIYGKSLPHKGETVIGNSSGFFFGGKGANQAVQAARLGADVHFIGKVGKDDVGSKMIASLKKEGITTTHITVDDSTTSGTCAIFVDENGDNALMVAPNANLRVTKDDIDAAMSVIRKCDIFIAQLEVSIEAIEYAIMQAYKAGVTVILNPAPANKISADVFQFVDFLTPNETEAQFYADILPDAADKGTCIRAAEKLLSFGVEKVIITLGAAGSFYADNENHFLVKAFKVDAVDATAAGDAFNAGVAYKLGQGVNIKEAIVFGNAVGAVAASKKGAQSSLAKLDHIEMFIEKNKNEDKVKKG